MVRIDTHIGLALLAMVALTSPARAEEQGSDWLGAVGDFVRAGLGPARTIDDIRREEERAREAHEAAAAKSEAAPAVNAVAHPAPVAPAPAGEAEAVAAPVFAAPAPAPVRNVPEVRPVTKPAAAAIPVPAPVARPAMAATAPAPAPVPLPVPVARPKPVAAHVPAPQPPAEPLTSRIAATATLDQAIKLGGSTDTYGQRVAKPVRN